MRILVLTSSTGGGHNMRASSLKQWSNCSEARTLGQQVTVRHALEETHGLYKFGVELYNWIQRTLPALHHLYYNYLEVAGMCRTRDSIVGAQSFMRIVKELQPQVIVSVHGSLNHGFFELARKVLGKKRVRCVTYCGELHGGYGFSKHWVNPEADLFIGAVKETCEEAIRLGMAKSKCWPGGFLLKPSFYDAPLDAEARRSFVRDQLRLDPNRFILLLSSSAQGANNHLPFLNALHAAKLDVQVVTLCGRSPQRMEKIEAWNRKHPELTVRAMPHSDNMHHLLQVCDAVVTRGGTGTTSESILSGCPLIINGIGGIMPQERITIKYCRNHGIARVAQTPVQLVRIIGDLLRHPEKREEMRAAMAAVRPAHHPLDILKRLAQLAPRA